MHMLPRVREIEERFGDDLVVIGVHAGKFAAERRTQRIQHAMQRLGVAHPVVNDRQFRVWRAYGVQAWPTIVIVSPDGQVLATRAGEFATEEIAGIIARALAAYSKEGLVDRSRPRPTFIGWPEPPGPFAFPTRVLRSNSHLYVSDSGHNRVVELRLLEGRACPATGPVAIVERVFGCGEPGLVDGALQHTCFHEPQGLALRGWHLFVADRANHAVRSIDLNEGSVATVAGTGDLGSGELKSGVATGTALRSPWGLLVRGERLLITMAGTHQLWALALDGSAVMDPVAGTGAEAVLDGPAGEAQLAQPTGLTDAGASVMFVDSESSAVRVLDGSPATVRTIVGTGLFAFGDRDGAGDSVLLQHPEDLAWHEGRLYVADTYNDKIKVIHPDVRTCTAISGEAGSGEALSGPAGIASGEQCLYVADTDAHRIVSIDVETGTVRDLEVD
jgi:DNA-binding beta-propeller fold protein YncE